MLAGGLLVPAGNIHPVVSGSILRWLVPDGIIRLVFSASALAYFIRYI